MKNWELEENKKDKTKRLSILIFKFPYSSKYGGGEWHTLTLTQEIKKKGAEVFLVSSCKVLLEEFKKRAWHCQAVWGGIEPVTKWSVCVFPFLSPFIFLWLSSLLFYYKLKYKVNILYCLSLTEKILCTFLAKLLGMKVFWMEHLRFERWLTLNPFKIFYIWFSRWARVICVSQAQKQQLIHLGIPSKNIKVIYNGIDLERFRSQPKKFNTHLVIGTVCRLCVEKGVDDFLKAAKLALEKIPHLEFRIVGTGDQEQKLKRLADELKITSRVKFLGFQKDIPEILSNFDIFVLVPFRRESFGLAAAEAMAMGMPVIATSVGGLPEVVEDGRTGFIVPPRDYQAIASAMIRLAQDENLREKMGRAGRERVSKNFDLEKMINKFYQAFSN